MSTRLPDTPGTPRNSTAQQRYYYRNREKVLAYAKRWRHTRPDARPTHSNRHDTSWRTDTMPAALVTAALSGIPERWHDADVFGPGPYLWHCGVWQEIDALPHVCPGCGIRFFEKEAAA